MEKGKRGDLYDAIYWPGYSEQSWEQRFRELERRHNFAMERVAQAFIKSKNTP